MRIGLFGLSVLFWLSSFSGKEGSKWFIAGDNPKAYYMGLDKTMTRNGTMPSTIRSLEEKPTGFGTVMTQREPAELSGHTIRLTGYIKSKDVKEWAGFWLRLDGENNKALGFENMAQNPVRKTTGWKKYTIEMDVPAETHNMAYGALLAGPGQIWFADVQIEIIK